MSHLGTALKRDVLENIIDKKKGFGLRCIP